MSTLSSFLSEQGSSFVRSFVLVREREERRGEEELRTEARARREERREAELKLVEVKRAARQRIYRPSVLPSFRAGQKRDSVG